MSNHSVRKMEIQTEQNDLPVSLGWGPEEVEVICQNYEEYTSALLV